MPDWSHISQHITDTTGEAFDNARQRGVGGGSINAAHVLESDAGHRYFVKLNRAPLLEMFEAEAEGLNEMLSANAIKVPKPVCWGISGNECYIAMEYIALGGKGSGVLLGQQLATMHRKQWDHFGWTRDNTIGSTPQPNTPSDDWVAFYREHRLRFQLELAAKHGGGGLLNSGERLMADLDGFFIDYQPVPSLLHGDLWGGNYSTDQDGNPVIFDPATYYGDREADIAMTELFGGFPPEFYAAYNEAWPLDAGYKTRKTLYNLYHVINHFNLFGGGYLSQADHMISSLLSKIR
jgi:protein-ribulosamine 3-kinase